MNVLEVLEKLEALEREMSETYRWISTRFPDDGKLRTFFTRMSEEERAHGEHVRNQIKMVRNAPGDFGEVEVDLAAIDKTAERVARFRETTPTAKGVIRFALDVESEVTERYATTVMSQSNEQFARVMKQLTGPMQEKHYRSFIEFAGSYDERKPAP